MEQLLNFSQEHERAGSFTKRRQMSASIIIALLTLIWPN
jgi:hypothetical protein